MCCVVIHNIRGREIDSQFAYCIYLFDMNCIIFFYCLPIASSWSILHCAMQMIGWKGFEY